MSERSPVTGEGRRSLTVAALLCSRPSILVHGGISSQPPAEDEQEAIRDGLRAAVRSGGSILDSGGTALDAVDAAVRSLEDHPLFNAGLGAALTSAGAVELDASIMDGDGLRCGAVATVSGIANPITLARRVMEDGRHVLLCGEGALAFARRAGIPECDPRSLITDRRLRQLKSLKQRNALGTVGAVAVDARGSIAAATSTGGRANKVPGRIGDSPLIGCGAYADSRLGGVSCTGEGEAIIRVVLACRVIELLSRRLAPEHAARAAIETLVERGRGQGGLILLTSDGAAVFAKSLPFMPVAAFSSGNTEVVA